MAFFVTKTYGHDLGLSACFRQWRAKSHCRFLHGFPLSFKLTFQATSLDENNWVIDFGGLKEVKAWLCETFDHNLIVAGDDPQLARIMALGEEGDELPLAQVVILPYVGCEGFAEYVAAHVKRWLHINHPDDCRDRGLRLYEVEVREHGGNSAIYRTF
jgi:6-pyruvoyltetrahydropterin/6-carboxytetrahydropterin synthase